MSITLQPAYKASNGNCYSTYKEAQKAELEALFRLENANLTWNQEEIANRILDHAAEIREILKPQIGRPLGSRNGTQRVRKPKVPEQQPSLSV